MRRIPALLLAFVSLAALVSLLAGCGGKAKRETATVPAPLLLSELRETEALQFLKDSGVRVPAVLSKGAGELTRRLLKRYDADPAEPCIVSYTTLYDFSEAVFHAASDYYGAELRSTERCLAPSDLPTPYPIEAARADGCVIFTDGVLTAGGERLLTFALRAEAGETLRLRLAYYYDAEGTSCLCDLSHDAAGFTCFDYTDRVQSAAYPCLLRLADGEGESLWLTRDPSLTAEAIRESLCSSRSDQQMDVHIIGRLS